MVFCAFIARKIINGVKFEETYAAASETEYCNK
jgi:hypothetical protein